MGQKDWRFACPASKIKPVMKVLYIHNEYARPSGEEHASSELASLLQEHGHKVEWFKRSSAEIAGSRLGMVKSFFTGIYNPYSARQLAIALDNFRPDIVQVQNLYPLLSTSIFKPLKDRNIPIVMRCPNYRLFCPNGLCLDNEGKVCEKCFSGLKEWWCVWKNCEGNHFKSLGYAVRNCYARMTGAILRNVDCFIVQSEFQRQKFIEKGIPIEKIGILPGISPVIETIGNHDIGDAVTFVGRVSAEKGINEFVEAAKQLAHIPFKVAGNIDSNYHVPNNLPSNIEFLGFVGGENLNDLYRKSRIIVVPSKWYEGFPNVIVRGMLLERPVVTTNIGAMQSIIDDGINGRLVPPGDATRLSMAIEELWGDKEQCVKMGVAGRQKALKLYSRENIYKQLEVIYHRAQQNNMERNLPNIIEC